ncbi:MAG: hypothetical protein VCD00_15305 [Candidatus Hydrogenedentota bacterium]
MTWLEMLVILVILVLTAAILLPPLLRDPGPRRRASCANNLKQLGLSMKMYANESRGEMYPALGFYHVPLVDCDSLEFESTGRIDSVLTNSFHIPSMYPEYVDQPSVFVCYKDSENRIGDPRRIAQVVVDEFNQVCAQEGRGVRTAGDSYTYLAHYSNRVGEEYSVVRLGKVAGFEDSIWKDLEVPVQLGLYANLIASLRDSDPAELIRLMDGDLGRDDPYIPIEGLDQSAEEIATYRLFRLREGLMRFLITDINAPETFTHSESGTPVMFDNAFAVPVGYHHLSGNNVLYLDGHVAFVKYGESFVTSDPYAQVMDGLY